MKVLFLIMMFIITIFLFYRAYKNTQQVILNKVKLSTKNSHHPHYSLLNILQISDMHLENISISPEQLYNKLAEEKIDLIALTGDFLDKKRSITKLIPYLQVFNRLNAKYGIYVVFGNHDYKLNKRTLKF
jgi:uncharacterized protein